MQRSRRVSTYERWIQEQGVPIVTGYGVESLLELPRAPWPRMGGKGTILKLEGMQGETGMYVAEIPPGRALHPEQHLYEELIYVLRGHGATELSQAGSEEVQAFEWEAGSLFSIPLNTRHRLYNGSGTEPVVFMACTNAPMIIDLFYNLDFVFGDKFVFKDRYDGSADYFVPKDIRSTDAKEGSWLWETNFVPDVLNAKLDPGERKGGRGARLSQCELSGGVMVAHINEWPVGRYHKAHHHGAGAAIIGTKGLGFSLIWPQEAGIRPFEAGNADKVIKIDWRENGAFCPPHGWFHQHFNSGPEPTQVLALRYGSKKHIVEYREVHYREGVLTSIREGGTMIEYEDEDPAIRELFEQECAKNGVQVQMPPQPSSTQGH